MSVLSEESRQIVASLAHRIGANADIAAIARAIVSTLQGMDAALTPIIGHQGGSALYRRSLQLAPPGIRAWPVSMIVHRLRLI
jgi:hypothetical protein